jgi:phosphoribosylanthranilate isomerase
VFFGSLLYKMGMTPPKIKICGLREAAHVQFCVQLGVDYVGFVAYPKSPRHVSVAEFHSLLSYIPHKAEGSNCGISGSRFRNSASLHTECVLVTVDATNEMLDDYLNSAQYLYLQCHGNESPTRVHELKLRYGVKIIKALSIATAEDLKQAEAFKDSADMLLLDAKPAEGEIAGGNARSFDWTILQSANLSLPYMLSGGLTPQNVANALRITHAPMVDVSSGVELVRGIKSPERIKEFVDALRHAT